VLGPGLYPWVRSVGIRNDDLSSLQVVDSEPTTSVAPVSAHMALFEHAHFRGAHRHVFQEVDSFYRLDRLPPPPPGGIDQSFDNKTSSMVVFLGNWKTFADPGADLGLSKPFLPILGFGLYENLPDGIDNDAISSVTPVTTPFTASGSPLLGHTILFENGLLRGGHKHIFNKEPDLNASEDDSFNDETSSLVVYPSDAWDVKWNVYADSNYKAQFNVTLGEGQFRYLKPTGIANDQLSSLELAGDRLTLFGTVEVKIDSGNFPDPIDHDVSDMTFILLSPTTALLLEKPFEPFPGPSDSTVHLVNAGTGNLLPDGSLTLPAVQIIITVPVPVIGDVVMVDISFDLTTGSVQSPPFMDTGSPRDPSSGAIKLVGAGKANNDPFLVVLQGTLRAT
jgi:hypothetical protein